VRLAPNPLCWGRVCLLLPLHGPVALLVVDPSRVAWSRDVCTLPQAAMAGASPAKVDGKKAAGADRGAGAGKVLSGRASGAKGSTQTMRRRKRRLAGRMSRSRKDPPTLEPLNHSPTAKWCV